MNPATERTRRLLPLGTQRLRILSCLGGDVPRLPQYFDPGPAEDVFVAYRAFVERMLLECASASDPLTRSLVGAGQLLSGDLAGARAIIENLPDTPAKLDHGAGYCLVAPVQALAAALPELPRDLKDTASWLRGSAQQAALRAWLDAHQAELVWNETDAVYGLVEPTRS